MGPGSGMGPASGMGASSWFLSEVVHRDSEGKGKPSRGQHALDILGSQIIIRVDGELCAISVATIRQRVSHDNWLCIE